MILYKQMIFSIIPLQESLNLLSYLVIVAVYKGIF